jgi:hypothetical protein
LKSAHALNEERRRFLPWFQHWNRQ